MSIRTTEPGTAASDEGPEPERSHAPHDDEAQERTLLADGVAPAPLDPPHAAPEGPAASTGPSSAADEDAPPGDGQELGAVAEQGQDLVAPSPQDLAPTAPAPTQDLSPVTPAAVPAEVHGTTPAVPERSASPVRAAPIEPATSLDPVHDASPATAAGGAGAGSGPGAGPTSGKGRGRRPKKDPEGRMALREHLTELRKRVVRAGIFVLAGAIGGWFLYDPLLQYLIAPLKDLAEERANQITINFSNVASSFDLKLKGAVWIGFVISSPFWIYQLWAFITPGLTRKERRYAIGFVSAAVPLFLGGVYLASLFIPRAVTFFTSFTPQDGVNIIDAPTYIGFVLRTVLTFGLAFLLPVVLVALNFAGLLPGRAVLKAWRWVLVASLTFAAIATPTPDVIAMFTLAAPIVILFAVAIAVCLVHDRGKAKRSPSYAGLDDDQASDLGDDEASPL